MENSEQTPGNKEMPQYPKPGDELQKHIETVIPDAEKEAVDSANAAPEQAAQKQSGAAPEVEKPSSPNDEIREPDEEKPRGEETIQEDLKSEGNGKPEKETQQEEKPKDAGDAIETVST
jgi:hypothetical protein